MSLPLISVVVPVYNEAEGISKFHGRTSTALSAIEGADWEIVYVDDGSRDSSLEQLETFAEKEPRVAVVKLSRNFGHQTAITAGLDHAEGDCVVFIDADLQDPPELIGDMFALWADGFDVVYGRRARRDGETRMKLMTAAAFYRTLRAMTNIDIPQDVGDFRLISRRVADQLRGMREQDRYVRGLVSWVGFRQTELLYNRDERIAGETKYPYRKMIRFALDGITSFSTVPLKLATWLGYASSALGFLYLASVFVQKLLGYTVQGWATIMVALLFFAGVQLVCLGIIGEYIGRIFTEIKGRPLYVVDRVTRGEADSPREVPEVADRASLAVHPAARS